MNIEQFNIRMAHCYGCPRRQHRDRKFVCDQDGVNILYHARDLGCPLGKYDKPLDSTPDIPLAGDVVAKLARLFGADRLAKLWERATGKPCGCKEREGEDESVERAAAEAVEVTTGPCI